MPLLPDDQTPTTATYENMLDALLDKNVQTEQISTDTKISAPENANFAVLSPEKDEIFDNLNNYSAVLRFTYGNISFMLTGDAETEVEENILAREADITSKNEARKQKFLDNFKLVRQKLKDLEEKDRIRNFQPPVDGEEIMRIFDLQPCREIGSLKSSIKDAILDGIIPNEHDAALEHMLKKAKSMGLTPKNL